MPAASLKVYLIILFNTMISSILILNLVTLLFDHYPNNPPDFTNFKSDINSIFKKKNKR
jgi:hypothetical protein